jgi:hypothetical protein
MARTIAAALDRLLEKLSDPASGIGSQLRMIAARDHVTLAPPAPRSLILLNASPELLDQASDSAYPQVLVFGDQMENEQREKFSYFSGTLKLAADIRISAERLDRLEADIHRYAEAFLNVLCSGSREWGNGLVFTGRYSVSLSPVRIGGNNFLQSARISFPMEQFVGA